MRLRLLRLVLGRGGEEGETSCVAEGGRHSGEGAGRLEARTVGSLACRPGARSVLSCVG